MVCVKHISKDKIIEVKKKIMIKRHGLILKEVKPQQRDNSAKEPWQESQKTVQWDKASPALWHYKRAHSICATAVGPSVSNTEETGTFMKTNHTMRAKYIPNGLISKGQR